MKKILFMLLFPILVVAQTQKETEDWIVYQTMLDTDIDTNYKIEKNYLISEWSNYISGGRIICSIDLKSVKTIAVEYTKKYMAFVLKCDADCSIQIYTDGDYVAPKNSAPVSVRDKSHLETSSEHKKVSARKFFLFSLNGEIDKTMQPRMEKALLHLVELNGGKAKIIPYIKPKDTF